MEAILLFLVCSISLVFRHMFLSSSMNFQGDVKFNQGDVKDITYGDSKLADEILSSMGDVTHPNLPDESITFSGDIDAEDDKLDEDEFIGSARAKTRITGKSKDSFPSNFLKDKVTQGIVKTEGIKTTTPEKVKEVATLAKVPGGLLQNAAIPPLTIVGGKIKRAATVLKLDGQNFFFALQTWMAQYPGLSSISSALSTGATITFTITAISSPYATRVVPIFLTFTANDLSRVSNAQVALTFAGPRADGSAMSVTGDLIEIFSDGAKKTVVCFIPYLAVKQRLHAIPIVPAANPNELIITLVGVPSGTQVVLSLAGDDDTDWAAYRKMIGM